MHRAFSVFVVALWFVASPGAQSAHAPVKLTKAAAAAVIEQIRKDRTDTETWLRTAPTSYLAAIDRADFGEAKTLSVGRAAGNAVRLESADVSPHHLRVSVAGDRFRIEAVDSGARFKVRNEDRREALVEPSAIRIGRYTLRLSHQGFPAIIVFDPNSRRFKDYKGLKYFPADLSYRFELPLTPNPAPESIIIMSTLGHQRRALRVGWFDFMVGTTVHRLEATRLLEPGVGEEDVSVFFRDATSGAETYAIGRYLDVKKLPTGRYLLDFNSAYNPACAYSPHYNCPIPPKANALKIAVRAGEMDSHYD